MNRYKNIICFIIFFIIGVIIVLLKLDSILKYPAEFLIQKKLAEDVPIIYSLSFDMKDSLKILSQNKDLFEIEGLYNKEKLEYYMKNNVNGKYDYDIAYQMLLAGHYDDAIKKLEKIYKDLDFNKKILMYKVSIIKRMKSLTFSSYCFEENWSNIYFQKGLCNLRSAELDNCINNSNPNACILNNEYSIHTEQEFTKKAINEFEKSLKHNPKELVSRWLLNINYANVGCYPKCVDKEYLIDFDKFSSKEIYLNKFENIATQCNVDAMGYYGGVAVEDFNNDGILDIFVTSASIKDNVKLYLNKGNYNFENATDRANLTDITGGVNLIHGDYNNDGYEDIYIIRGGWMNKEGTKHPNSLLQNNGDGTFTDVTEKLGLLTFWSSHTASWADINSDGYIDLFVGNERANSQLFININGEKFIEASQNANITLNEYVKGATWLDYNNDGQMDLYVSTYVGYNHLYKNLGPDKNNIPKFLEVTNEAGVKEPFYSFPVVAFDFNNDGLTDILCADFKLSIVDYIKDYIYKKKDNIYPRLYLNNGDGTFTDKWKDYTFKRQTLSMGINVGDINNDGFLDIYLGTSYPDFAALVPNLMYLNMSGVALADITNQTGLGMLQKGHGIAFADLGNRGVQDIYANFGGWYSADVFQNALFKNTNEINNFVVLKLIGTSSNKSAIGAKVKIRDNGQKEC